MANTNETSDSIIREMRGNSFDDPHLNNDGIIGARRLARGWADRLESAIQREREESGNSQKMREALKAAKQFLDGYSTNNLELRRKVDAALAAPPRGCDLMSAEALSEVIARGITASIEDHPALNSPDIRKLIDIGSATAIACAYDTKLKATKEVNTNG